MRRYSLAQPQPGAQVDVDHEPQVFGRRAERVTRPEGTDGVHEYAGRADLGGDPVDDALRRVRISSVGYLPHDGVRKLAQRLLVPVDRHDAQAAGREGDCGGASERTASG